MLCGLSEQKYKYIISLTEHFMDCNKLKNVNFNNITDEELFNKLIQVKGLGAWSIHMFMIFQLYRNNILPTGDLAVRRGICILNNLPLKSYENGKKSENELKLKYKHWEPYSTIASIYMWDISNTKLIK